MEGAAMTMPHDQPNLDDVLETEEEARPNRREHAKTSPRPDDDELEERVEVERSEVGLPPDQPT
jgi:hypothetical protein